MRCLVTGASGFVGSHLVRRLLADGAAVVAVVRPQSDLWRLADVLDRVTLLRSELGRIASIEQDIIQSKPDVVFHLAWQGVTGGFRNDHAQILENVPGSLELLRISQGAGCRCWVGLGSQAEYGPVAGVLSEGWTPAPVTAYGVAKLCVQMLAEKFCALSGMRFLWFRLLTAYGPQDDPHHLIVPLIRDLLASKRPALTLGEQRWDYLYVDDAVEALAHAALVSEAQGVFNLGSGRAQTIRSIVEQARDLIDPTLALGFGEIPYRSDQIMHLQADITRLKAATNWEPRIPLTEGLKRTIDWYQDTKDARL